MKENYPWNHIADCLGIPLLVTDQHLRVEWLNQLARQWFGDQIEGCLLDHLLDHSLPHRRQEHLRLISKLLALIAGERLTLSPFSLRLPALAGQLMEITASRLPSSKTSDGGFTLLLRDITQEQSHLNDLQLSAKVFEYSGEAILITDPLDRILAANEAFTRMTGYAESSILGQRPDFLRKNIKESAIYQDMWQKVKAQGHWKGEVHHRRPSGEVYPVWLAITAVRDSLDDISHYISIFSDITERKAREEHIRYLAEHDYLTRLPNRVLLQDRFTQAIARLQRDDHSAHIALLFIDLDGFKQINDEAGHGVGDDLLQVIARRLEACMRKTDSVCRYGGDEFVLLLTSLGSEAAAEPLIAKVLEHLSEAVPIEGNNYRVGASIGVAFYPRHGDTLDTLLERADEAMYQAKQQGKNRWQISD